MKKFFSIISVLGFCICTYMYSQNLQVQKRMQIPILAKGIRTAKEDITKIKLELMYCLDPTTLVALSNENKFSHLQYPLLEEVWLLSKESLVVDKNLPSQKFPFFSIILGYYGKEFSIKF